MTIYKCKSDIHNWTYEVIQKTDKTLKLKMIFWVKNWFHNDNWEITLKYNCYETRTKDWITKYKMNKNRISYEDENCFISYLNRQWIPFIFTIKKD